MLCLPRQEVRSRGSDSRADASIVGARILCETAFAGGLRFGPAEAFRSIQGIKCHDFVETISKRIETTSTPIETISASVEMISTSMETISYPV